MEEAKKAHFYKHKVWSERKAVSTEQCLLGDRRDRQTRDAVENKCLRTKNKFERPGNQEASQWAVGQAELGLKN